MTHRVVLQHVVDDCHPQRLQLLEVGDFLAIAEASRGSLGRECPAPEKSKAGPKLGRAAPTLALYQQSSSICLIKFQPKSARAPRDCEYIATLRVLRRDLSSLNFKVKALDSRNLNVKKTFFHVLQTKMQIRIGPLFLHACTSIPDCLSYRIQKRTQSIPEAHGHNRPVRVRQIIHEHDGLRQPQNSV